MRETDQAPTTGTGRAGRANRVSRTTAGAGTAGTVAPPAPLLDLSRLPAGRQLRVRRVAAGLSQWDLARRLGVRQSRVSLVELLGEAGARAPKGRQPALERLQAQIDAALRELEQRHRVRALLHPVGAG